MATIQKPAAIQEYLPIELPTESAIENDTASVEDDGRWEHDDHAVYATGKSQGESSAKALGHFSLEQQFDVQEEIATPPTHPEHELIGRRERLQFIAHSYGFYPTSLRELSEAFNVKDFMQGSFGTAKHIAEISRHQNRHEADPVRAALAVTREFGAYARRAKTDYTALKQMQEEITSSASNRLERADRVVSTGLNQLVRYMDLKDYAEQDILYDEIYPLKGYGKAEESKPGSDDYVREQPNKLLRRHVDARVAGIRLWQAEEICNDALQDQAERFHFWVAQLQPIARHQTGAVRAVAHGLLRSLHAEE